MRKELAPLLAMLLLLSTCAGEGEPITAQQYLLDTVCTITLYNTHDKHCLDGAFALISDYEKLLSRTVAGSDIDRINKSGGVPCTVSHETAELLALALAYSALSDGRFDPTVGAATALWDFSAEMPTLPDARTLAAAAATIDYRSVLIDGDAVTLQNPNTRLDLGAIAKGFVADRVKRYLEEHGVKSAIIDLGGDILTVGNKPDGGPFHIGIQLPFASARGELLGQAEVTELSVVTSGIYERGFELDGVWYHHILEPETGMPTRGDIVSATVFSANAAEGDALSTICLLLDSQEALAIVEALDGVEAVLVREDGSLAKTAGIGAIIPFE